MNAVLQKFAREWLVINLSKLPEGNQRVFKLMYGFIPDSTIEEAGALSVFDVVQRVPADKLDWAMQQVINTTNNLVRSTH